MDVGLIDERRVLSSAAAPDWKAIEVSLDDFDRRISALERLDRIDTRFDEIMGALNRLARLKIESIERRLSILEAKIGSVG